MKIKFSIIVLSLILTIGNCFCQTENDSTYWKPYDSKKISITGYLSRNSIEIESNKKNYSPNIPMNIGASVGVKNTILYMEYRLGLTPLLNKAKGKTHSLDVQLQQYGRHVLMDLFVQNYKGFYCEEQSTGNIELRPELSVWQIGAEGTYLFNGNKFSAKAAFKQKERQLKSVGSFVIGGGAYWYKLNLSEDLSISEKRQIDNLQLGVNAGYAYSWVINPHWLMSGVAAAGFHLGNEMDLLRDKKVAIYPTAFARGSLGYHKADWGVALFVLIHNNSVYVSRSNMLNLTSINMQIAYTKSFDLKRAKK